MSMMWNRRSYSGKHICITGGSEGLGFALASLFLQESNTRISLISRTLSKLESAKEELRTVIENNSLLSRVYIFTGDCRDYDSIHRAIDKAQNEVGDIDVLICNAGMSIPGKFLDSKIENYSEQMEINYLGTVYTIKSAVQGMVDRRRGEIVLISSALGILGMTGYSSYAPTKWALRGLADCLRMELQAYGITVRIAYPPDMDTPGYQAELKQTPPEVLEMMKAAGDTVFKPIEVAKAIVCGMKQNKYHLPSPDFLQTLSQATMSGLSPAPYFLVFQSFISAICVFLYAHFVRVFDKITEKYAKNT